MNCNTTHYRANSSSVPGDPNFDLDRSAQGQGLGRAYADHFREIARKRGVREMCVHAGETLGGYVWATPDWVFAGEEKHQRAQLETIWQGFKGSEFGARNRARWAWEEGLYPKALFDEVDRYFYALATGAAPVPTPHELAQIGRVQAWQEEGRETWLGKLILQGSNWEGREFLTAATESLVRPAPRSTGSDWDLRDRRAAWAASLA